MIAFSTLAVITAFILYLYIKELIRNSDLNDELLVSELNSEDLESMLKNAEIELERTKVSYEVLYQRHDQFLGKMVDEAVKRINTVYYVPRLNEQVEFVELVEVTEL